MESTKSFGSGTADMLVFTEPGMETGVDINRVGYSPPPSQMWSLEPSDPKKLSTSSLVTEVRPNLVVGETYKIETIFAGPEKDHLGSIAVASLESAVKEDVGINSFSPTETKNGDSAEAKVGFPTRAQTQKSQSGREEVQSQTSDSTCVCAPKSALDTKRHRSQDTILVRGAISRSLPLGTKARVGRKLRKFLLSSKKRNCSLPKSFSDGENLARQNLACPAPVSFWNLTGNNNVGFSKNSFVEDWLDVTVGPLLKNKNLLAKLIEDGRLNPHLNWKELKNDCGKSATGINFAGPRDSIHSKAEIQNFTFEIPSDQDSIEIMENDVKVRLLQKLLLQVKLKSLTRKLGQWLQKVRVVAKCGTPDGEAEYGLSYDKSWKYDYCPEIYYAAAANSEEGSVFSRNDNTLVCGQRRIPSSSSLCFSEGVPGVCGSDTETDENESLDSFNVSNIRVILPSGEIGFPSKVGIFCIPKSQIKLSTEIAAETMEDSSSPNFTTEVVCGISTKETQPEVIVPITIVSEILKGKEDEEVIEEVFTNKLATDSFSKCKSADKQLFEVFKQYREGTFEKKESQIAAAQSFTQKINEIFRASCDGSIAITEKSAGDEESANAGIFSESPLPLEGGIETFNPASAPIPETLPQPSLPSAPVIEDKPVGETRPSKGNDTSAAFGYCEEEVVNPFFGEVVTKCSQGFMKEIKLVQKFFVKAEKSSDPSGSSATLDQSPIVHSESHSSTVKDTTPVIDTPNEVSDFGPQDEQFVAVVQDPFLETTEDVSAVDEVSSEQVKVKSKPQTYIFAGPPVLGKECPVLEEAKQKPNVQVNQWWKFPLWPKANGKANVENLWDSLSLNKFSAFERIKEEFADEDLQITWEVKSQITFLPDLKNVIVEKANHNNKDPLSDREGETKVSFSQEIDEIIPAEIDCNIQVKSTSSKPSNGILRPKEKPRESFAEAFPIKYFEQPLDPDERKEKDLEIWENVNECEKLVCETSCFWKTRRFEKTCLNLKVCWRLSLEFNIKEAEGQILNYTYYLSQISNAITSLLEHLVSLGNYFAILVDFIANAETTNSSLDEVKVRIKTFIVCLESSRALLAYLEMALMQLNTDSEYVEAMIDIAKTGLKLRQAITNIYRKFLKDNVKNEEERRLAHKLSEYPVFYSELKDFTSNEELYETETFLNFGIALKEALIIVTNLQTVLVNRSDRLLKVVTNFQIGFREKEEKAPSNADHEEQNSTNEVSEEVYSVEDKPTEMGGSEDAKEVQEMKPRLCEEITKATVVSPVHPAPTPEVVEVFPKEAKKFEIPSWMKFQQFGKTRTPA